MKLWLVSSGSYSEYKPLAVFDSQEDALECSKRLGTNNEPEEISYNEMPELLPGDSYGWHVQFNAAGDVVNVDRVDISEPSDRFTKRVGWRSATQNTYEFSIYASGKTEQDAVKSAADTRRMALAMNVPLGRFERDA